MSDDEDYIDNFVDNVGLRNSFFLLYKKKYQKKLSAEDINLRNQLEYGIFGCSILSYAYVILKIIPQYTFISNSP